MTTEIFSVERPKEEYMRTLSGKGKMPAEALIRYSVDSSEIAERMAGQGKTLIIISLGLFFGSLALNWITVKIGFVIKILVVAPLAAVGILGFGLKNILVAQFSFLRRSWVNPLCMGIFILSLVLGLVGFIYYLLVS